MAKKKSDDEQSSIFSPYADIDNVLDDIEKDYGLISSGLDKNEKRLSTGLLVLDLIMGKGVAGGGWYTLFGGESCAKSTTATTIMANSVNSEVPIVQLWDYEGSSEPNYLENILQAQGIKVSVREIFGIRDPETSKYVVKPRVRLYNESIAEKFFDSVAKLQRFLPDKLKFGDDWFYVYNHTKENIALLGGKYDKTFYQKTGKMRVPAENGMPQALLLVDSYPAMLPEGQDVDDPKSAMAMQARMFSEQIKRVKGKMKNKRITVVGMNQLREKPMVMYGCNHASNIVTFEDGSTYTIKEVVNNRLRGNVLSYSEDYQTFEYRPITGWHYNGEVESSKDWVVITTETGSQIVLTRDHEVLTAKGWYKAIDLKLASRLYNGNTLDSDKPKYVTVKSLTIGYDETLEESGKYDITVKENHNYIVGDSKGIIVHNSPHYEPGGQSLKFYSDCRVQVSARSNIYGKGMLDEEPSYDGNGTDKYRYIHAKATKNKLSTPYLEGMMRVWVEDANGKARGFDPVFDTYQYLLTTGQLSGKRNSFKILIPKMGEHKALKWNDFKTLIIGDKQEQVEVFKKLGVEKPFNLRKFCQKQLEDGDGLARFFDNFKNGKTEEQED